METDKEGKKSTPIVDGNKIDSIKTKLESIRKKVNFDQILLNSPVTKVEWVIDSGASTHICNDKRMFSNLKDLDQVRKIGCANSGTMIVEKQGDIVLRNPVTGKYLKLEKVDYVKACPKNLLSESRLRHTIEFRTKGEEKELRCRETNEILHTAHFDGKLYTLELDLPDWKTVSKKVKDNQRKKKSSEKRKAKKSKSSALFLHKIVPDDSGGSRCKRLKLATADLDKIDGMNKQDIEKTDEGRIKSLTETKGLMWHHRLGHMSKGRLEKLKKNNKDLKKIRFPQEIVECVDCRLGKARRKPFKGTSPRATKPLEKIHSDMMGPIKPNGFLTHDRYIVTFTDDYSRYAFAYSIKSKLHVHLALEKLVNELRVLLGSKMTDIVEIVNEREGREYKCALGKLHTDQGTEYKTKEMKELIEKLRIVRSVSHARTPEHNGVSERLNLEIEKKVRTNLISAGMPEGMWNLCLEYVMYIHNRSPNRAINYKTPFEVLMGEQPTLNHIRRFGCQVSVLTTQEDKKRKFTQTGKLGFLIGIMTGGYKVLMNENNKIVTSHHVDCMESRTYGEIRGKNKKTPTEKDYSFEYEIENCECCEKGEKQTEKLIDDESSEYEEQSEDEIAPYALVTHSVDEDNLELKSLPEEELPMFDIFDVDDKDDRAFFITTKKQGETYEPETYKDAMKCKDKKLWREAINEELDSLTKCGTWQIVPRSQVPKGSSKVDCKWLFKQQPKPNNEIRYKARIVARGFKDSNDYMIDEVYAPVAAITDVRVLLAIATKYDMEVEHLDVKTAFLNGELEKEIFMFIPEGVCEYLDKDEEYRRTHICRLVKSIYGLKVSPKRWYDKFSKTMSRLNMKKYDFRACLYYWREKEKLTILLVYVDDIMLVSNDPKKMTEVKTALNKEFEISDLGPIKKFLGMDIFRDRKKKKTVINQSRWAKEKLSKFDHGKTKRNACTPMLSNEAARKSIEPVKDNESSKQTSLKKFDRTSVPYRNVIGALLYIGNCTRPDITFAVNKLSRNQKDYTEEHWTALQRVLRYIRNTIELGITFEPNDSGMDCYVDASLGSNEKKGRSTTGWLIKLYGCTVDYKTIRQGHRACSTSESEYVAMSMAVKQIRSLNVVVDTITKSKIKPIIWEDNESAIKIAMVDKELSFKHLVHVHYHYIKDMYKKGLVEIRWVSSKDQEGDFFTKPLPLPDFIKFRNRIMNIEE